MSSYDIIVFGPTGAVGSVAARTARANGARKVFLAMRDVERSIPGLSVQDEQDGRYERVQADLMNPVSVEKAVRQSAAKRAFMYIVHGASDVGLRSTIMALKSGGVELVIFLSTFAIHGDLHTIPPSDLLPWAHAQVEMNLAEIFGPYGYIAVRPTWFTTNILNYRKRIQVGTVEIPYAQLKFDWITPVDIGSVVGALLTRHQPHAGESILNLVGPEQLSNEEAMRMIGKSLQKDIQIVDVGYDEGKKIFMEDHGLPEFLAAYLVGGLRREYEGNGGILNDPLYKASVGNVERELGRPPTRFQEWINQNLDAFTS